MRAVHILCLALMLGATVGCSAQTPTMTSPDVASIPVDGGVIGDILENGVTAQVNVATVDAGEARDVDIAQSNRLRGKQNGITAQVNVATVDAGEVRDVTISQRNRIRETRKRKY